MYWLTKCINLNIYVYLKKRAWNCGYAAGDSNLNLGEIYLQLRNKTIDKNKEVPQSVL